jgi:hypothetical protein
MSKLTRNRVREHDPLNCGCLELDKVHVGLLLARTASLGKTRTRSGQGLWW